MFFVFIKDFLAQKNSYLYFIINRSLEFVKNQITLFPKQAHLPLKLQRQLLLIR
jgi:hypothetical protein